MSFSKPAPPSPLSHNTHLRFQLGFSCFCEPKLHAPQQWFLIFVPLTCEEKLLYVYVPTDLETPDFRISV